MALELIDMALDQAEADRVWTTYQDESDDELDEADMELEFIGFQSLSQEV
jgi:hypothetical protein